MLLAGMQGPPRPVQWSCCAKKSESYVSEDFFFLHAKKRTEYGVCSDTGTRSVVHIVHFGACESFRGFT